MNRSPVSRRQVLQAAGLSTLPLGLPGMVAAGVDPKRGLGKGAAKKSCIFILCCGGPSHLDTWDLKPNAPDTIRGPYQPIPTRVPGMQINEMHTRLAQLTEHIALIRSMTHVGNISNHFDAMHHLLSGQAQAPLDAPYIGSILSKARPDDRSIAPYVWLIKCVGDPVFCTVNIGNGGHLGMMHSPLFVGSATNHPAMPNFKAPDELIATVPTERMLERRRLLDGLNPIASSVHNQPATNDWQDLHGRAFDLTSGSEGREPFELHREPQSVRDRYGMHPLGQNLLLATPDRIGSRLRHRQRLDRPVSKWRRRSARLKLGHARWRDGNGQRLREWFVWHGLVPAVPRRRCLRADYRSARPRHVGKHDGGRHRRVRSHAEHQPEWWCHARATTLAKLLFELHRWRWHSRRPRLRRIGQARSLRQRQTRSPTRSRHTIFHSLGVPLDLRLGKDGFTRPLSTGEPLLDLFA